MRKFGFVILVLVLSLHAWSVDPPELRAFYAATFDVNTKTNCDTIISEALRFRYLGASPTPTPTPTPTATATQTPTVVTDWELY